MNMRRILTLGATALFVSALAFAETYSGKLVDASCAQQQQDAACTPTASTSAFALQVSGKLELRRRHDRQPGSAPLAIDIKDIVPIVRDPNFASNLANTGAYDGNKSTKIECEMGADEWDFEAPPRLVHVCEQLRESFDPEIEDTPLHPG